MQRTAALIPYSKEHHDGLLIALRLKKGGPSSPHDTLWPTAIAEQRDALLRFAEHDLYPHFDREEQELFPAITSISTIEQELREAINSLHADHQVMREMLKKLEAVSTILEIQELLRAFGTILEAHIRKEEREVFPMIERYIDTITR